MLTERLLLPNSLGKLTSGRQKETANLTNKNSFYYSHTFCVHNIVIPDLQVRKFSFHLFHHPGLFQSNIFWVYEEKQLKNVGKKATREGLLKSHCYFPHSRITNMPELCISNSPRVIASTNIFPPMEFLSTLHVIPDLILTATL